MIYNINKARTNHSLSTILFGFHSICAQSPYPYFVSIGLPKSWFGIFHNIVQNTRTNLLAKPIFNKYFLIINILSLKLMSSAYVITTTTLEQPLAGSDFFNESTCWRSVAIQRELGDGAFVSKLQSARRLQGRGGGGDETSFPFRHLLAVPLKTVIYCGNFLSPSLLLAALPPPVP